MLKTSYEVKPYIKRPDCIIYQRLDKVNFLGIRNDFADLQIVVVLVLYVLHVHFAITVKNQNRFKITVQLFAQSKMNSIVYKSFVPFVYESANGFWLSTAEA